MKCFEHYDRDAVATCVDCGKALCPECAGKFTIPLCNQCSSSRNNANTQLFIKNGVMMIALFLFGFFTAEDGFLNQLMIGYFCAGIPWGWSFLNKITSNMFLFMSWFGWVIYFISKLVLSMLVGMFVTPFKIYGIVKGLLDAKKLQEYTNSSNM